MRVVYQSGASNANFKKCRGRVSNKRRLNERGRLFDHFR